MPTSRPGRPRQADLDQRLEAAVLALLHDLHDAGRTIVLITHEAEVAARAERTIQIRDGLVWSPEPEVVDALA